MNTHFRTVFLSDTHLGFTGCRAEELAFFLHQIECDKLYLVGDLFDMWRLKNRWYWPESHNDVIRRILALAQEGTEVVFIPGNHDAAARDYVGLSFGGVLVKSYDFHRTADGRRLFVIHGDQYDLVVKHSYVLHWLGDVAYKWLIRIHRLYNGVRHLAGQPYFSLARAIKKKIRSARLYIERFEESLIHEAERRGADGVVCGHIHHPGIKAGPIGYFNCGDWVETCTLLAEHQDGAIELIDGIEFNNDIRGRIFVVEPRLRAVG